MITLTIHQGKSQVLKIQDMIYYAIYFVVITRVVCGKIILGQIRIKNFVCLLHLIRDNLVSDLTIMMSC
jgi:hypothetical protein